MDSAKRALKESVSFEALFDEHSAVYGKEAFKEAVFMDLQSKGKKVELDADGGLLMKEIDGHASRGYNVFSDANEYQKWLQQSLHDPTQEEITEAMKNG